MNESTKQIIVAVAAASAATAVSVLLTHWLTTTKVTQDIASGKTPLPADATPTFKPTEETPKKDLPPKEDGKSADEKAKDDLIAQADKIARVLSKRPLPCPPGFKQDPTWDPNDANKVNLPRCIPV